MHCFHHLPGGYRECLKIELQKDKKSAVIVNAACVLAAIALMLTGNRIVPLRGALSAEAGTGLKLLRLGVMLLGLAVYLVLHELTHAAAMKLCGAHKLRFGFTGLYAFAGSEEDYFGKRAYRFVALAPLVLWTPLIALGLLAVPRGWFWVLYFLQIMNVAGSAGDVYVTLRILPLPGTVLVRDTGVDMTVYDHVRINIR